MEPEPRLGAGVAHAQMVPLGLEDVEVEVPLKLNKLTNKHVEEVDMEEEDMKVVGMGEGGMEGMVIHIAMGIMDQGILQDTERRNESEQMIYLIRKVNVCNLFNKFILELNFCNLIFAFCIKNQLFVLS